VIYTVIPAKPFKESKSRLAAVLSPAQRVRLSRRLLAHTISAAAPLGGVVVVSRSGAVRQLAKQQGAYALVEGQADLNAAVRQGLTWSQAKGATSALVLPLDLPLLSTAVLRGLLTSASGQAPGIVIAPCRHGRGTNALLLSPPTLLFPRFGPDSFARHQQTAREIGLQTGIYCVPELAFDLDTAADWEALRSEVSSTAVGEIVARYSEP
jgi:2-phospho-L-lactate guanylyltransferase